MEHCYLNIIISYVAVLVLKIALILKLDTQHPHPHHLNLSFVNLENAVNLHGFKITGHIQLQKDVDA